jgi:hypothetical protein
MHVFHILTTSEYFNLPNNTSFVIFEHEFKFVQILKSAVGSNLFEKEFE